MLPRSHRLTKEAEYAEVYRAGRSARGRALTCLALPVAGETRLGVVASRRVGDAVERNRAKRRLRHAARDLWEELPPRGYHLVAIATPETGTVDYRRLLDELRRLLSELGVVAPSRERPPRTDR
jgi:ribonuclease P protein component